jgi:hypothetical protein
MGGITLYNVQPFSKQASARVFHYRTPRSSSAKAADSEGSKHSNSDKEKEPRIGFFFFGGGGGIRTLAGTFAPLMI